MEADTETRLMFYMTGWRKGVLGEAVAETSMKNQDFRAGYSEGRAGKIKAYAAACLAYGTTLNPLRNGEGA